MNRIWLIVVGDFVSFFISFILLIVFRFNPQNYLSNINTHIVPFIILYFFWVIIFYIFGLYDLLTIKPTIPYLKRWVLALTTSFVIGLLLFYFVPIFGISPKLNLIIIVLLFGIFSFLFRRIIYIIFAKTITRPAILVGNSAYLIELENIIKNNPQIGFHIINHFKNLSELNSNFIKIKNTVIILDKNENILDDNIIIFYKKGIEIIDTAKAYEKYLYKIPVEYVDVSYIVENLNTNKDIFYKFTSLMLNNIFSLFTIIITSPFVLITMFLIYIEDKGPVFYTQERIGLNGKVFKLFKLRSMKIDSEKNGALWSPGPSDPRITRVGRIIRKLHIDEIPQMFNILKGDISLVGPRPERPEFVNQLENTIPHYKLRHIIHPGFTGWAQIKYHYARTNNDSKEKFEYDLYYIKNRNIFIDIGIILRTIQIVFTHK